MCKSFEMNKLNIYAIKHTNFRDFCEKSIKSPILSYKL